MALLSPIRKASPVSQQLTPCTCSYPTYSCGQQCLRHAECKGPCQIPTCRGRLSCQVNVANGHQDRKLRNVAMPYIRECQDLPSNHRGKLQGPYDTDPPRRALDQTQVHITQSNTVSFPTSNNVPAKTSNELYVVVDPVSKLYTDDMGWFPIRSRSGHHYIMLEFNCDSNVILIEPFQYRHDRHHIAAYSRITMRLHKRGHAVELQVLVNEASAEYFRAIIQTQKTKFQLVPLDVHRPNAAECTIRTFKAHFLAILAGVDRAFPSSL